MGQPMIRVDGVYKRYGSQQVLEGATFSIPASKITTIMGRSGSGKSCLIRHMIGLEKPDRGAIFVDGKNIVGMKALGLNRIRRRFGVLFQEGALFDSLTVRENVAFPIREHKRLPENQVIELVGEKLSRVGMKDHQHKYPSELSGGMKKRVGLARALALQPEIVLFDEPTAGLDPITRSVIHRLIRETHEETATTYVLVSHDIEGMLDLSDEIIMLLNGRIASRGTPDEIRRSRDPAVRQFITGSPEGPIAID